MNDLILIAEIKAAANVDAFVLVDSYSDFSERFFKLKKIFIEFFGNVKEFVIEDVKKIDGRFAFKIKGFDTKNDAALLIGKKIFVDEKSSVKLPQDAFFIHDLIASDVYRNNKLLGYVKDVLIMPANDVYVIYDVNKKKDILVPAVKDYVIKIDIAGKRLELKPDCDLLYDDEN